MAQYLEITTGNGTVFMEVDEQANIEHKAGGVPVGPIDTVAERFRSAIDVLTKNASEIIAKVRGMDFSPDEIEVSFGIKAAGELGNPIFALAKGSVEAGYSVTMKWKREDPALL